MASPLTVTTPSTPGAVAAWGPAASAEADAGASDVFAALLGAQPTSATTAAAGGEASAEVGLGNLFNLSLAGFGADTEQPKDDPEAIAAMIDAVVPIQPAPVAPAGSAELTALAGSLAEFKQALDGGEPIEPQLLQRIDGDIEGLAAALDIDLRTGAGAEQLKALVNGAMAGATDVMARLTEAAAPLAQSLLAGAVVQSTSSDTDLSKLVQPVGEKLASLLAALNGGGIDPQKLEALGLTAPTAADAELEAALAKLATPAPQIETSAAATVLATPALKLTEPVLTGRTEAEAGTAAPDALANAAPSLKAEADADTGSDGRADGGNNAETKTAEPKPLVTVAAAAGDKVADSQIGGQPAQQTSARVDAVAAPRVVQTGYQTSQQQLNLPQIAFELARQTVDGNTRFQIRLDPAELGRIDVQLDIDTSGQINARLVVEKAETLDLMQRDQRGLEKALHQAGLDSAKTSLEFSLKQNGGGEGHGQPRNHPGRTGSGGNGADEAIDMPPTINLYRASLSASGVNIIA